MGSVGGTIWMNGPATVQGTAGRATIVANGNLYNTRSAGIYWFPPGGTPMATTADALLMAGADQGGSPAPASFAIAPAPGTIAYLANYQNGNGIARYDYDSGSGTWVFSYKFTFGEDPVHIAVDFTQSPPVLYVVGSTLSKLYRVVDPEAGGATTGTILATVTSPAKFRGVALSPVQPAAPVFTVHPASKWYWSSAPNNNHLNFGGIDQANGAAYFSFILQITQGSALSGNKYDVIAGFTSGTGGSNADNWIYKLCTHTSDGADWYQLGVFKGDGATINAGSVNGEWAPTLYARNDLHLIVGCYKFNSGTNLIGGSLTNDDVVTLWIDPPRDSFGAAEGSLPTPTAGGTLNTWGQNAPITQFALKGLVEPASKNMSDLRIGTTWASVTQPYYPTIQYVSDLSGLTLSWPAKDSADVHGSGYYLQESPDLVNWSSSANTPYQDGSVVKVVVTPGSGPFFRLQYP